MELESSILASQNALTINPPVREPQRQAESRQQQQRAATEHPPAQVVVRQGNSESLKQADSFQQQKAIYDQPDSKGRQAIESYQSLQREDLRDNIRQSLGVDTYV